VRKWGILLRFVKKLKFYILTSLAQWGEKFCQFRFCQVDMDVNSNFFTRPNLKIENKLKTKRDKASIVGGIFCGDIRHELNFEF